MSEILRLGLGCLVPGDVYACLVMNFFGISKSNSTQLLTLLIELPVIRHSIG